MLTVIFPTYYAAMHIEQLLDTFVSQNFRNTELLIIDGSSTDKNIAIAKTYTEKFEHIRIYTANNLDIYDAMNKGTKLASGE